MSLNFLKAQENPFSFLREDLENTYSFFSKQGLGAGVIEVTRAESDIPLEVFYALHEKLLPIIHLQQDISLQDAWNVFLRGSQTRGILTPLENLIIQKRVSDILEIWSDGLGITHLKTQLSKILSRDIFGSLTLVEKFYEDRRNTLTKTIKAILHQKVNDMLESKGVMLGNRLQNHWAYRIQRKFAKRMISLDEEGNNLQESSRESVTHCASALSIEGAPKIFFKANGYPQLQPQKEYVLYGLYKMILIPNADLLVLSNVFDKDPHNFYTIQASEAVSGASPQGSIKNLIIDMNIKSFLFTLSLMEEFVPPNSVKTFYMTLDPEFTLFSWLRNLCMKNREYYTLEKRLSLQNARLNFIGVSIYEEIPSLDNLLQIKCGIDKHLSNETSCFSPITTSNDLIQNIGK